MNLLTKMAQDCVILNRTRADDNFGGYTDTWTEGARFRAAIGKMGSPEMLIAEKQGLTESFTVVVDQDFTLNHDDVFKRLSDNAIFRVTSNTKDSTAHPASSKRIAKVTAERWVLPS